MDIFYGGRDLDELYAIFGQEFRFDGPFYSFESASRYVESLKADPPVGCAYELCKAFEDGNVVNLIYDFIKDDIRTPMSQLFEIRDNRIVNILLIFDTAKFT